MFIIQFTLDSQTDFIIKQFYHHKMQHPEYPKVLKFRNAKTVVP